MSALDDVIEWAKETQHEDLTEAERAREELELLREAAFSFAESILREEKTDAPYKSPSAVAEEWPDMQRILRTDPERAREMGLGWAL